MTATHEGFKRCANCRERIEEINFALGPQWRHWPTPHGNYSTREKYRYCQTTAVATPESDDALAEPERS